MALEFIKEALPLCRASLIRPAPDESPRVGRQQG